MQGLCLSVLNKGRSCRWGIVGGALVESDVLCRANFYAGA